MLEELADDRSGPRDAQGRLPPYPTPSIPAPHPPLAERDTFPPPPTPYPGSPPIAQILQFDEVHSRRVEATYLTPDIVGQRKLTGAALNLKRGEDVLDVGCGPGLLAREMAADVGPEGRVDGIDPSPSMLAIAQQRASGPGVAEIHYALGDAGSLLFADGSFDAVVTTQAYEYVKDVAGALEEARRVLRRGGRLLIVDTDWDSIVWHSSDRERMQRVLGAWDKHLVDAHLPRRLPKVLRDAGFDLTLCQTIPLLNAGFDPNTYSAHLIDVIRSFVSSLADFPKAEAVAWAEELPAMGQDYFFSLNRYLFLAVSW